MSNNLTLNGGRKEKNENFKFKKYKNMQWVQEISNEILEKLIKKYPKYKRFDASGMDIYAKSKNH